MVDVSPDTSWLGEYSNRATSEFSIDRAHSEDCIENDTIQKEKLERIADAIENDRPVCETHIEVGHIDCEVCAEEYAYTDAMDVVRELAECDCGERGDRGRHEYRYFNPYEHWAKNDTETDKRACARSQYERMESLHAGNWCFMGIRAEAQVQTGSDIIQDITSGGLWGIESDSGKEHIQETIREELSNLKIELLALGFSKRAIASAFKPEHIREKND